MTPRWFSEIPVSSSLITAAASNGSIVPTALGVNPSLTIAALSLRIADNASKDLDAAEGVR